MRMVKKRFRSSPSSLLRYIISKQHISLHSEIGENDAAVKPLGLLTEHEYSTPRTEASAHQIKQNLKRSLSFLSHLHLSPQTSQLWKMTRHLYPFSIDFMYVSEKASGCCHWSSRERSGGRSPLTATQPPVPVLHGMKLLLTGLTILFKSYKGMC